MPVCHAIREGRRRRRRRRRRTGGEGTKGIQKTRGKRGKTSQTFRGPQNITKQTVQKEEPEFGPRRRKIAADNSPIIWGEMGEGSEKVSLVCGWVERRATATVRADRFLGPPRDGKPVRCPSLQILIYRWPPKHSQGKLSGRRRNPNHKWFL